MNRKNIFIFLGLIFIIAQGHAVNLPLEPKRGLKRHFEETPQEAPDFWELLKNFVEQGNVAALTQIIDSSHIDVNTQDEDDNDNTLLLYAVAYNQLPVINALLDRGADVNVQNREGLSPLIAAVEKFATGQHPNAAVLTRLLQVPNIALNATLNDGQSVLHRAVQRESVNALSLLLAPEILARGIDLNLATPDGITPLILAIDHANTAIIQKLLEAGADVNKITEKFFTPLWLAVDLEDAEAVRELLKKPGIVVDAVARGGLTPLMAAAESGSVEIVKELIAAGADITKIDENGHNALWHAQQLNTPPKEQIISLLEVAQKKKEEAD